LIKIEYSYTNFNELLRHVASSLRLKLKNNSAVLTPAIGDGSVEAMVLKNGLQLMLFDYTLKEEVLYHRKKANRDFYLIRIDDAADQKDVVKSSLLFSHVMNEWFYLAPANTRIRHLHILFSKDWLRDLLVNEPKGEMIMANLLLNVPLYHYELFDSEYRRLLHDILLLKKDPMLNEFTIRNRVMLIVERLLTRYYRKITETGRSIRASPDELQRLKQVESEILKDFSFTPPNINQLSRMAAMSASKLKQMFKEVFGMPVYQYYQKHRLQRGKAMLITKKYSLKEVASELGYTHVKDFSKAFYKHFDQLPEELISD